jgi:hypothetical protein
MGPGRLAGEHVFVGLDRALALPGIAVRPSASYCVEGIAISGRAMPSSSALMSSARNREYSRQSRSEPPVSRTA